MKSELIDKLTEQATENRPYNTVNSDGKVLFSTDNYGVNLNKFAELIVKECAVVAYCNFHVDGVTLGGILKEHFGIEE